MDRYIYLLLSLSLLCVWLTIYLIRENLRQILLKISLIGGVAGLIAEFWYFKDYWRPPSLFGNPKISPEDFLFGFAFTGIAATIYKVIISGKAKTTKPSRKKLFLTFFVIGLLSLFLFTNLLKINSIVVSSFVFLVFSVIMIFIRKDLLVQSIVSGLLSILVIIPIYLLLFDFISPAFWDKYWLLANTTLGIKVLGNIPLTELLWYFSWGCLAGIAYDFYHGSLKKHQNHHLC